MEGISSASIVPDPTSLAAQLETSPLASAARFIALDNRKEAARVWRRHAAAAGGRGRRRQVACTKKILSLGFMVTSDRSLNGLTALHAAVACGAPGTVALDTMLFALKKLPKLERPLDIPDLHGLTPLAHAVQANWGDGVRKLVSAGADVSQPYTFKRISEFERVPGIGASLLSFSVALQHMDAFYALIECGADAKLWDSNGMRAVHIAVICGNVPAVRALMALDGGLGVLSKKEAMELYIVREKCEKGSPFSAGRRISDNQIVEDEGHAEQMDSELSDDDVEDGDNPDDEHFGGSTESGNLASEIEGDGSASDDGSSGEDNIPPKKLNEKDATFGAALMLALKGALQPALARFGKIQRKFVMVSLQPKRNAMTLPSSVTQHSSREQHVFHIGNMRVLASIAHRVVNDTLSMSRESLYGASLLHLAVERRHHDVVQFLIEKAPYAQPVDVQLNNGMSALHIAADDGNPVAIELLINAEASVHRRADSDHLTPLMRAAKKGHASAVKILLEKGGRVSDEDDEGLTALHFATESKKSVEVVEMLVAAGADVNAETAEGCTPCYTAVSLGHMEVFRKLLELGGDPSVPNADGSVLLRFIATKSMKELALFAQFVATNPLVKEKMDMDVIIGDQGATALHLASLEGSPSAVEGLLKAGCDVNKLNENGVSGLFLVAQNKKVTPQTRLAIMKHLLEGGADANSGGEEGNLPLHFVTFLGEFDAVELLLHHGAGPMVSTKYKTLLHSVAVENFPSIARLLIQNGVDINNTTENGITPLMKAALWHSTDVLKVLIEHGADMTHQDEAGMTALHIAGVTHHPESEDTVRLLCEAGAPMDIKDGQGRCPIHLHGDFKQTGCVRRMLMAGCNPDARCSAGLTPLLRVCNPRNLSSDKLALIRVLLRGGADVKATDGNKNTVMSFLARTKEHRLIRIMLAAGADIDFADKQGGTPLHEAAMGDHAGTVTLLARRGANVNAQNEKMETPLFIAATNGFDKVVKALVHKWLNTDIFLKNIDGVSPYEAARLKGHDRVTKILLNSTGLRLSEISPLEAYSSRKEGESEADGVRRHQSGSVICTICQEGLHYEEPVRLLPCGHWFHDACILPWLGGEAMNNNITCPVCKQMVAPAELLPSSL